MDLRDYPLDKQTCNLTLLSCEFEHFLNPSTPKSDQFQISPAASPESYITQYGERGFS